MSESATNMHITAPTYSITIPNQWYAMSKIISNKTNETSPKVYSKDSARFIKQELSNVLDTLQGELWVDCNAKDRLCLDMAIENIEEVYDKVTDFEQAALRLTQS